MGRRNVVFILPQAVAAGFAALLYFMIVFGAFDLFTGRTASSGYWYVLGKKSAELAITAGCITLVYLGFRVFSAPSDSAAGLSRAIGAALAAAAVYALIAGVFEQSAMALSGYGNFGWFAIVVIGALLAFLLN